MTATDAQRTLPRQVEEFPARDLLFAAGLRATQQRLAMMELLFGGGSRQTVPVRRNGA